MWRYAPRLATAEFLTSPGESLIEQSQWLPFFPAGSERALLTSLDEIRVNRPYLIDVLTQPR